MALRSLGTSLLAKARPGSVSRETTERRIVKPEIPGKGAVGTATRNLTQETEIVPPAPGSEKVLRAAPGVESASLPGVAAKEVPLVAGVGMPNVPAPVRAGAAGNGMFAGAPAPASEAGQAGRQAQGASSEGAPVGAVAASRAARTANAPAVQGAQTEAKGGRVPFGASELPNIGIFGSRVRAGGGEETAKPEGQFQPTALQYASGAIGKALTSIGTKFNAPQLVPGGAGARLQTFGGAATPAAAGKGSIEKVVQNVGGALRSLTQSVSKGVSKLRSLFGR